MPRKIGACHTARVVKRLSLKKFYDPVALLSALPVTVVVVVGAFLSYRSHAILRQNRDLVVHTYEVMSATQRVLLAAEDAETGQRGFIITGDPAFLEPYRQATQVTVPQELKNLEHLIQDSPRQQRRVLRLEQLLAEKFHELARTVQARQQYGYEATRSLIANQSGKRIMDEIRHVIADIVWTEQTLLSTRTDEVAKSEHRIIAVGVFTALLSTLARLMVAFWRQQILREDQQPL